MVYTLCAWKFEVCGILNVVARARYIYAYQFLSDSACMNLASFLTRFMSDSSYEFLTDSALLACMTLARLGKFPDKIHVRLILPIPDWLSIIGLHDLGKTWQDSWQDSCQINLTNSWLTQHYWLAWPWQDMARFLTRFFHENILPRYLTTSCDFMQDSFKILNDIFNIFIYIYIALGTWRWTRR